MHRVACEKTFHAIFFFISAYTELQTILLASPWHKDSKTVLRFEIESWEVGEKIGQTNKQTDRQTDRQTDGFSWILTD